MSDATLSQGHHVFGLVLKENNPHDFMQNLHANWGAVQIIGRGEATQATIKAALAHFNPYASSRVEPRFFNPEEHKPRAIEEQVGRLRARCDWLDDSHVAEIAASWPEFEQADGLYVVPKPTVLAARLGIEDPWTNFGLLIEQGPIAAIASAWEESGRKFTNYRVGKMGSEYYRLNEAAKKALMALEADHPGDVLVFPAQSGKLYAGYCVADSRLVIQQAENPAQWPLPFYVIGWMLYANPDRLTRYEDLAIDAPGDEYSFEASGGFDYALYFRFGDGALKFAYRFIDNPDESFGSASGFVRQ